MLQFVMAEISKVSDKTFKFNLKLWKDNFTSQIYDRP